MREVDVDGLVSDERVGEDLVVRHFLDRRRVRRAWLDDEVVVVEQEARDGGAPLLVALGGPGPLGTALAGLAAAGVRPGRVIVDAPSLDAVPWPLVRPRPWFWMTTRSLPPTAPDRHEVVDLTDHAEVDVLLDAAFPESHTRPATAGAECWLGVHLDGRLVSAGALTRRGSGSGHLGGIATLPSYAGRGLGTAVTAALTGRALAGGPGLASLGVYTDNAAAVTVYRRLGYRSARTFVSGPVA
ncbi:MAG: mshD 1 [Nocardioides sp.]|nr:mshD 1 [Nocardioides sp.]